MKLITNPTECAHRQVKIVHTNLISVWLSKPKGFCCGLPPFINCYNGRAFPIHCPLDDGIPERKSDEEVREQIEYGMKNYKRFGNPI